jgi:hypothetical protein
MSSPIAEDAVAALACEHTSECLHVTLIERLFLDQQEGVVRFLQMGWRNPNSGGAEARFIAGALITRLRAEGAGHVADAFRALLDRAGLASVFSEPVALDDLQARADGPPMLQALLVRRLELDGHPLLARKLTKLMDDDLQQRWASDPRATKPPATPVELGVNFRPVDPGLGHQRPLAARHGARVLFKALVRRLGDEGHDVVAGHMMWQWAHATTGPLVNPRILLDALIHTLRHPPPLPAHLVGYVDDAPRPALAAAIERLFKDVSIDRDPDAIMRAWCAEVTGADIQTGPLAAAFVYTLSRHAHAEYPWLEGEVLSLLRGVDPPILPPARHRQ